MADAINNTVEFAGEIVLDKINLIDTSGRVKLAMNLMFVELDIYEDIFSNFITGSVTISEGYNLATAFPIIGEELLEIEYHTPAIDTLVKKTFYVFKRSSIDNADKKAVYVIHFASQQLIIDINSKHSRAYSGTPSDIVKSVFNEFYKNDDVSLITGTDSSNYIKFISNYWTPSKCINYATSKATAKTPFRTPTYLFYETNKGFKFTSLEELYNQAPLTEYFYDRNDRRVQMQDGTSIRDIQREYMTAESMIVDNSTDFLDRVIPSQVPQ